MKIALIGYGKMGKAIEQIALERGHEIIAKITSSNLEDFTSLNMENADVAIEFTNPDAAFDNVMKCIEMGVSVVSGSTGWNDKLPEVKQRVLEKEKGLIWASNFSIGANIFFEVNKYLATLMNHRNEYDVSVEETHHTFKKDKPSGTAVTIAEQIISRIDRKSNWKEGDCNPSDKQNIAIKAHRIEHVPGVHSVKYFSEIDEIEIKHTAHSRTGFALGAVLAAEFLKDRTGNYTMEDVLNTR